MHDTSDHEKLLHLMYRCGRRTPPTAARLEFYFEGPEEGVHLSLYDVSEPILPKTIMTFDGSVRSAIAAIEALVAEEREDG